MRPFRVLFCRPGIQNNLLFLNAKPNLNSTKNRLCTSDGFGCGKIVRFRQCLNSSLNCVTALVATCCLRPVFDWCQHGYNPQQFGSDSADIRMWIQINLEIWIQISDQFWLLDTLAKVCTLCEYSLVLCVWVRCLCAVSGLRGGVWVTRHSSLRGSYQCPQKRQSTCHLRYSVSPASY